MLFRRISGLALLSGLMVVTAAGAQAAEVNVYSGRIEQLMKPLLNRFQKETGITVNLLTADADQLVERVKNEGANSPGDVLITVDVGRLFRTAQDGLFLPVKSATLEQNIPPQYRDPDGKWFGLSLRSRVIFYANDRVKPSELSTYEDLADPKWKGRICVRSSGSVYNQSLLSAMIAVHGEAKAEEWAKGVTANMARKPQGGDRDQIKAVAAGECDLAIANTYYYGGLQNSKSADDQAVTKKVGMFFPDQKGRGAHVNVSGAGVLLHAKHVPEAIKLIEFLSSNEAQHIYAEDNMEYPVKPDVAWSGAVKSWGTFKADSLNVAALGANQPAAIKIFDRVGWR
jgi:iron(III) transport system substrate-binding protein